MLNISDNLKTILKQNTNALDVKVIYGASTYSYDDINGLIITDSLTSSGIWTIGQAPSRQLALSLEGNNDFLISPYDETTTTTDAQGNSTVSVNNNDEAETDIDKDEFAELFDIDVDDTEDDDYEYPDDVEELTGDELTPRTFPEDWTLYPIVVKLGINNQSLDNTSKNDDIQEVIQQIIDDGDTVETLTIEPDSEDYDSDEDIEIDFDTLIDMMEEAETDREDSGETEITYTYFTLGTFYVDDRNDVTTERDSVEVIAYDKLYTLRNVAYTSTLTYPTALSNVTAEMATNYGINWNANVPNITINKKPTGTVREALQKLALYCGANVNVEPEGDFEFVYPAEVDFPINSQMYHNLEMADDMALISKLDIISEGQTYDRYSTGDTTGKTASFFTDYITSQAEVDNIGTLSGLPFYWRPYVLTTPLYPHLEIGDIITAVDKNNEEQKLMIAKLEIVITHEGFIENFGCAIPTPQALGELGGFSQYIHSLKADLVYANTVIADKLDATLANIDTANISTASINWLSSQIIDAQQISAICANLGYLTANQIDANYASLNLLNSSYATINQLNSSYATINGLNASYAKVDLANINQGALERLFVDTGILSNAVISTASVTGMLNSVNVNADKITAGTLNVNRLNIYDDANGIIYSINAQNVSSADLGSLSTYAQTHQLHGNDIIANTITANQIKANTITANEIASNTITASQIKANTITANELNVSSLSAITANMGTLTAGIISGDNAFINLGSGSIRLGKTSNFYTQIESDGIAGYQGNTNVYKIGMGTNGNYQVRFGTWTAPPSNVNVFSIGESNYVTGNKSFVVGYNSTVSNTESIALGWNNKVESYGAIAGGYGNTITNGNYGVAFGYDNRIYNGAVHAIAMGNVNYVDGYCGVAIGDVNHAGYDCVALGMACNATSDYSYAFGHYASAYQSNQMTVGICSSPSTARFVVGVGQPASSGVPLELRNGLEIDEYGNATFRGSVAMKGKAYTNSEVITMSSGFTLVEATCVRFGRLAQLDVSFVKNSSVAYNASGDITDMSFGTLKEDCRPRLTTNTGTGGLSNGVEGTITRTGACVARRMVPKSSNSTISAKATTFVFRAVYLTNNEWLYEE